MNELVIDLSGFAIGRNSLVYLAEEYFGHELANAGGNEMCGENEVLLEFDTAAHRDEFYLMLSGGFKKNL